MKEFKLAAWPELPAGYHRSTYRRMLNDMSHRYVSVQQLVAASGATRMQVRLFLQMLSERGLLLEREAAANDSLFGPLGGWLRRAFNPGEQHRG